MAFLEQVVGVEAQAQARVRLQEVGHLLGTVAGAGARQLLHAQLHAVFDRFLGQQAEVFPRFLQPLGAVGVRRGFRAGMHHGVGNTVFAQFAQQRDVGFHRLFSHLRILVRDGQIV